VRLRMTPDGPGDPGLRARLPRGSMVAAVEVTALGYRTDMMLRVLEGSEVVGHGDYRVVRSPANPAFWWGNFLLLAAPPRPGEADLWLARFADAFPGAEHVALGIDTTGDRPIEAAEFLNAGFSLDRGTVMTAAVVREPARPNRAAQYRRLADADDWRQALELRLACHGGADPAADRIFMERRNATARELTEAGQGSWFGAFRGRQIVAQLGLFGQRGGLARYQQVETHPAERGRGLAGTLVYHAGRYGLETLAASTLVIVADQGSAASRIYHSVGFADREFQIGLIRPPAGRPEFR
jgi:hypothetical protein